MLDQDAIEAGVDLIDRIETLVVQHCGPSTPVDRALTLVARGHGVGGQ
jgi:hypothetical protein